MAPQDILTALRDQNPLVHCITNYVAMNIAANVVLAAGASPAMVHAPEEIPEFTPICGALPAPTAATVWTPRNRLQTRWRRSGAPWWRSPGRSIMSPTARKPRRFRAARP